VLPITPSVHLVAVVGVVRVSVPVGYPHRPSYELGALPLSYTAMFGVRGGDCRRGAASRRVPTMIDFADQRLPTWLLGHIWKP
jgi:hypothetical protein